MSAIVDHTRDHNITVQATQAGCGRAMHILLGQPCQIEGKSLPPLTWVIRADDPRLAGQAFNADDIRAWATYLKATVTEQRVGRQMRTEATTSVEGIDVHLFAQVALPKPAKAVA